MTESPPVTVHSLYAADATFRALVDEWAARRRCPLPLVDRCLDFDLHGAAECARWAATTEDRPPPSSLGPDELSSPCGPYPTQDNGTVPESQKWFWGTYACCCCTLPDPWLSRQFFDSPTAAILALLDTWGSA